jgi:ubiquitin C-terminal hydrolase
MKSGRWCADNAFIPETSCKKAIDSIQDTAEIITEPSTQAISDMNDNKENGLRPLSELQRRAELEVQHSGALNVEYQLKSVVNHLGSTIKRGHFVCDVQKEEEGWVCYNDSVCTSIGSFQAMAEKRKKDAYLLFYQLNSSP